VEYYGVHEVRGRQTVEEFVRLEAAHDLNHLRQIDRILELSARMRMFVGLIICFLLDAPPPSGAGAPMFIGCRVEIL
jgi:hypothetical protein